MSVEPPMISPPTRNFREDLRAHLPALADRLQALDAEVPEEGAVLSTRDAARALVAEHPEVSPAGAVYLDCRKVEIATPSYLHELRKLWPHVQLVGANEDLQTSWDLVTR